MATEARRRKSQSSFAAYAVGASKRGGVSEKEGVSLNQFINVAVAEKLAHLEHEEWVRNRKQPSREPAARALILLDKAGSKPVEPK